MLAVMKHKALALGSAQETAAGDVASSKPSPKAELFAELLAALKPSSLTVRDVSDDGSESRFRLDVVADCFEPLAPEKREQLVRVLVGELGSTCELEVTATAPSELAS